MMNLARRTFWIVLKLPSWRPTLPFSTREVSLQGSQKKGRQNKWSTFSVNQLSNNLELSSRPALPFKTSEKYFDNGVSLQCFPKAYFFASQNNMRELVLKFHVRFKNWKMYQLVFSIRIVLLRQNKEGRPPGLTGYLSMFVRRLQIPDPKKTRVNHS